MGQKVEAEKIARIGLTIDADNVELRSLISDQSALLKDGAAQNGPMNKNVSVKSVTATPDRDVWRSGIKSDIMTALKSLLNKISSRETLAVHNNLFQGTYRRLIDSTQFLELIYPGVDKKLLLGAPRSIYELLQPNGAVKSEIMNRLPRICDAAFSILEGVRKRGADRGDYMDRTTEAVLIPQISSESFALEVVNVVKLLNMRASAAYAEHCLTVASVDDERANRDQLDAEVVALLVGGCGLSCQNQFLTAEWANLVCDDLVRYKNVEKMSKILNRLIPSGDHDAPEELFNLLSWIDYNGIQIEYPALSEAISCLHSLPYEINGIMLLL